MSCIKGHLREAMHTLLTVSGPENRYETECDQTELVSLAPNGTVSGRPEAEIWSWSKQWKRNCRGADSGPEPEV